jgi:hypothetical protein
MKGVGYSSFSAGKVEAFQVELIGVLKNVVAPKREAILAKLSGGSLDRTGIASGMSGSPVYIDGKLLGAVAIAFPFSKEPYTLITPIEDMLRVVPQPASPRTAQASPRFQWSVGRTTEADGQSGRWIPAEDWNLAGWKPVFTPQNTAPSGLQYMLPLEIGGISRNVMEAYATVFHSLGFEPVAGGMISGSLPRPQQEGATTAGMDVKPGQMISMLLASGDLNLNVDCTVTYRDANNIYACGHQVFSTGPVDVPFAPAEVLATIPSLSVSFKIDASGAPVGSIHQDRFGAIYGVVGEKAPFLPVHLELDSTLNRKTSYDFKVAQEPLLTPLLVNVALVQTLGTTERMAGPSTIEVNGKIQLTNGDAIDLEDVVSSGVNSANAAAADVASPLGYLLASEFPDLHVASIDVHMVSRDQSRLAEIQQVWSSKAEVRPGDHIEVTAVERTPTGERRVQKIPVEIPDSVTDSRLTLVVGGGAAINGLQMQFTRPGDPPRDVHQMVKELNRRRRNNRLYALLMAPQRSFRLGGDEFPSPPPSLLQTLMADPAVSSSITFSGSSVIGDFETRPEPYAIRGQQTLFLKVVTPVK